MNLSDLKRMYSLEIYYPGHVFRQFGRTPDGLLMFNEQIPTAKGAHSIVLRSFDDGQTHVGVAIPAGAIPFYKRRTVPSSMNPNEIKNMWFLVGYELDGNRHIEGIDAVTREIVSLIEPVAQT